MKKISIRLADVKKKGKETLFIIPYFFTLANACFGFLSIISAFDKQFSLAAYCIMLAALMDLCDGRLARAFGSTSSIGMELDSLCDAVSFCLAPALLLYVWKINNISYFGITSLIVYLCAGLLRLARFNVLATTNKKENFVGLPTPLAAIFIAQLVLHFDLSSLSFLWSMIIGFSLLMVSNVTFLSFKKSKLFCFILPLIIVVLLLSILFNSSLFLLGLSFYIILSTLFCLLHKLAVI